MKSILAMATFSLTVWVACDAAPGDSAGVPAARALTGSAAAQFDFGSSAISGFEFVDSLGAPFVDTVLGERRNEWNVGAMNLELQADFLRRFAHLGAGFVPALRRAGLPTCYSGAADQPEVFKYIADGFFTVTENAAITAVAKARVIGCLLQPVRMPDASWRRVAGAPVAMPLVASLFHPNTLVVDLDTTGTWPFGRRPEDQVASRFTSLFLDMSGQCGKRPCSVDSLQDPDAAAGFPINPPTNDKPFLDEFPYLASPWPNDLEVVQP
jgi:hypothetical protein